MGAAIREVHGGWCPARPSGKGAWCPLVSAIRRDVPLDDTVGLDNRWKSRSEVVEETCQALERGFRAIKLKIGQPNVADDLERIEFVSRQLPTGVRLRLDANQGYSVSEAKGLLRALQGAEIQLLEQPVARWNLQAMKELRRHTAIPLLADEAVFDSHDVARLAFEQCADAVNIKPQKLGGLRKSMQCVEVAAAVGLGIFPSSRICTSVGVSACTHFYASLDRIDYEGEFADGLLVCAADVCTERVVITDGAVVVPGGEGIGVDIDDMKLARVSLGDIVLH